MIRTILRGTALAIWVAVGAAAALPAQPPPLGDPTDLTIRVSVDRVTYPVGTTVEISRSICNETPEPIRYNYFAVLGPYLEILDASGSVIAFAQPDGHDGSGRTIEYAPGECRSGTYHWFQSSGRFDHPIHPIGPQVPQGVYRARTRTNLGSAGLVHTLSPPFGVGEVAVQVPALSHPALLALAAALALAAGILLRR